MPSMVLVVGEERQQRAGTVGHSTGVMERGVPIWNQLGVKRQLT